MEIKSFIKNNLFNKNNSLDSNKMKESWFINNKFEKELILLKNITSFLPFDAKIKERIYCLANCVTEIKKCPTCGEKLNLKSDGKIGYKEYCSIKCVNSSKEVVSKRISNTDYKTATKKREQTNFRKYGTKTPSENLNVKNKIIKTNIEKYGHNSPLQNEDVQIKSLKTLNDNYSVMHPMYSQEVKNKVINTNLQKYGVENPMQNQSIFQKTIDTNLQKYGVENPMQNQSIFQKAIDTNLQKYGVENYSKTDEFKKKIKDALSEKMYNSLLKNEKYETLFTKEEFTKLKGVEYKFKCKKCNNVFNSLKFGGQSLIRCLKCYPIYKQTSKAENEIVEFISSLNIISISSNNREIINPYELDIYLPEYRLAVEFDGIYWHSSDCNDDDKSFKYKHLQKTELCDEENIQLLHIFENEWVDPIKQKIWKSIIKNKLKLNDRAYARKCEIIELISKEKKDFLNNNHLQSDTASSINLALKYNDEIVCCLTLSKPRFNKQYEWEIVRFANKLNTNVIGGFSKLLSYFRKKYKGSIITYADRRYSNGNLYKTNGFEELKSSNPNYFYFKTNENVLYSRIKFQKHKLKDILEHFSENMTESSNLYNNDYRRIWDCGNKVFVLKSNS